MWHETHNALDIINTYIAEQETSQRIVQNLKFNAKVSSMQFVINFEIKLQPLPHFDEKHLFEGNLNCKLCTN